MENAAFIISIVSIVGTIIIFILQYNQEKKLNKINLCAQTMQDIYKEYLVKRIPRARKTLKFTQKDRLDDISEMKEVLNNLIQDSLYYLYQDEKFFNNLKEKVQLFEDHIVNNSGKEISCEAQPKFYEEIKNMISTIYKIINDKYING